jgi:hypothetical protein
MSHTHIYNEILFSFFKWENPVTCNKMDVPGGLMVTEINPTQRDKKHRFSLNVESNEREPTHRCEYRMMVTRGWGIRGRQWGVIDQTTPNF